jgi:phage FluMu protein Com
MIVHNRIRCKHCGDVIESKHTHHYVTCKCGKVACDGGKEYLKRSFPSHPGHEHYEDLSVVIDDKE